ncbi:MAG: thioredoxin [Phycisphaerales bacterium]|nr:thioredoxin [Phycisphaerales bacterium]MCB9854278.1 thioredoxin [Phycisphaerales bacterium]
MFHRALLLTVLAAGLACIPSACNRESAATDSQEPVKPVKVAGATAESAAPKSTKAPTDVVLLSDSNFAKLVLQSDVPVVVDFYADWCGPCKKLAPILDQLAKEYDGKVLFGKINTDHNGRTSSKYSVRALPTVMIFKGGKAVETFVGLFPKDYVKATIDKAIK